MNPTTPSSVPSSFRFNGYYCACQAPMRPPWAATYPLGLQALMHPRLRAGILPPTEIASLVWDTPRPSASCHPGPTGAISGGRFETDLGRSRVVRSLPDRHSLHHVLCRCGEGPEECRRRGEGNRPTSPIARYSVKCANCCCTRLYDPAIPLLSTLCHHFVTITCRTDGPRSPPRQKPPMQWES